MRTADIGAAIDGLADEVTSRTLALVKQYRARGNVGTLKQAVDTPHRARAQLTAWIASYNARKGAGTAQTFLAQCLVAAGSAKTLAQVNAALAALETASQVIVGHVANDAWTWAQVADAIDSGFVSPAAEEFSFSRLPIPAGYTTVWGGPH